jgi:hypothetical protein
MVGLGLLQYIGLKTEAPGRNEFFTDATDRLNSIFDIHQFLSKYYNASLISMFSLSPYTVLNLDL